MALSIKNRKVKDVAILDLGGRITLGEDTGILRDEIASLLAMGEKKILVSMAQVSYVDSAGLGELVRAYTTATNQNAVLKLLHLQGKMKDLMTITKLHTVFAIFDDETAAIASFAS